jgi:hypothetical protein
MDSATAESVHKNRELLKNISAERLREEFFKLICGRGATAILREFYDVIGVFIPEILPCVGFEQNSRYHDKDVYLNGVVTRNMNYQNWGKDYSDYHEFQYENLTQDSTIEDVLEQYGMPKKLHCTSYARGCFAWLFYEDAAGNMLEICVDPVLNQITEVQMVKYYEEVSLYP